MRRPRRSKRGRNHNSVPDQPHKVSNHLRCHVGSTSYSGLLSTTNSPDRHVSITCPKVGPMLNVATNKWPFFDCELRSGVAETQCKAVISLDRSFNDGDLPNLSSIFSAADQIIPMSPIRFLRNFGVSSHFLACWIVLSCLPGFISSAIVTLDSVQIFKTHEWLKKPTFYFQCQGENVTVLPDVKKAHVLYTFKGEESWQPLTEITDKKCKRCGFYEKDSIKSDDVFDEWEFCLSDFIAPDGKYIHFKNKEFNATFLCPACIPLQKASDHTTGSHNGGKGTHLVLVIIISALVSVISVFGVVAACKYWQKRKREQDQARFLKLFEDGDDIEDELSLATIIL